MSPRRTQRNKDRGAAERPFWEVKTIDQMTVDEWESLCDRCGRCCMVKLEDEDTGEIFKTDVACKLFDEASCSCANYALRHRKVKDCIKLTPESVRAISWLPTSCAYRRVLEGKPLADWHPLVSGSPDSVHEAKVSVRGLIRGNERNVRIRDYPDHIVEWND